MHADELALHSVGSSKVRAQLLELLGRVVGEDLAGDVITLDTDGEKVEEQRCLRLTSHACVCSLCLLK